MYPIKSSMKISCVVSGSAVKGKKLWLLLWNSLTGLLVKELLCQSDQKPDYSDIVDNTSGVIFYSTPHRGSALANISSRGSRIFSPTVEVQELSQGKTPQ